MEEAKDLRAGVIALGMIGGGVASSLVNKGRIPTVYDIVPDAYEDHEGVPEQVSSLAEVAAASDVIMIAVFNYEQCKEVIAGENGLLENAHAGMVLVVLSTISVEEAKDLHSVCKEKGVGFLDCGVTPGSVASTNGLIAMVGGDEEVFEYAKPVLDDWSGGTYYCGEVGTGMACKLGRQINTYGIWRVTTEGYRLATAAGVDPNVYLKVLEEADKVDPLYYTLIKMRVGSKTGKLSPYMVSTAEYMKKDLAASKGLSNALDLDMPVRDTMMKYCKDTFDGEEET